MPSASAEPRPGQNPCRSLEFVELRIFDGGVSLRDATRQPAPVSNEGKEEQARAEERDAGCGQREETTGDQVMIAHESPSIAPIRRHRVAVR